MSDYQYPKAKDPHMVGEYPASAKSGGGYFWDEVLEYRVWIHPERGGEDLHEGNDYFHAFETFEAALDFSQRTAGAEEPLVLIFQREHINEPEPGQFIHVTTDRVTEWCPEWLEGSKRKDHSIAEFIANGGRPMREK